MADVPLIFGRSSGNEREARNMHQENFLHCRIPDRKTFTAIDRRLRENGTLRLKDCGRPPTLLKPQEEMRVHDVISENPETSTRRIAKKVLFV
jgi:hypothetical protein